MKNRQKKQGIALVIVLGFLSILTIMAVGFAISMRTERLVASAHFEQISSRQLSLTAMARAISDIDESVYDDVYPDFSAVDAAFSTNVLFTIDEGTTSSAELPDLSGIIDWVPGSLSNELEEAVTDVGWEYVYDSDGNTNGRISYVVANCSGFLDVNQLMQTNRTFGITTREIVPITGSGSEYDFSSAYDASNCFSAAKADWKSLLDQREIVNAYSLYENGKDVPDYLFPFSYAPNDLTSQIPLVLDQSDDEWYRGFDADGAAISNQTDVIANNGIPNWVDKYFSDDDFSEQMRTSLVSLVEAAGVYPSGSTRDLEESSYAWTDTLAMHNTGQEFSRDQSYYKNNVKLGETENQSWAHSEAFPSILPTVYPAELYQEIIMETVSDTTNRFVGFVDVKLINPNNIAVDLSDLYFYIRITQDGTLTGTQSYEMGNYSEETDLVEVDGNQDFKMAFNDAASELRSGSGGGLFLDPGESLYVTCNIDFLTDSNTIRVHKIQVEYTSTEVYWQCILSALHSDGNWLLGMSATYPETARLLSAYDPRVMLSGSGNSDRIYASDRMAYENISDSFPSESAKAEFGNDCPDETFQWYYPYREDSEDVPVMDSIAFIGRCPIEENTSYSTLPLIGEDALDIAKYFAITNVWPDVRGRININTPYTDVLAAGFNQAHYPVTNDLDHVDNEFESVVAQTLAETIAAARPEAGYTNVTHAFELLDLNDLYSKLEMDKFQLEELMMRSRRMFTTRQQIFTVYVTAQSLVNNQVGGEAKAVAVIWRDPLKIDGKHATKLLAFSYVE